MIMIIPLTTTSDALAPSPYNWVWGALCDTGTPTKNDFSHF